MAWLAGKAAWYRWGVALLAAGMWVFCFAEARLAYFGWQFRFLDVWALTASMVSAALMLRLAMGWSRSRHEVFVAVAAALNAVAIAAHLGPLLGGSTTWPGWKLAYLHVLGPALQIADAVLILGAFGRISGALLGVAVTGLAYVAWLELAVRPLNAAADGTGGLPYAALDAMEPAARLAVYAAATAGGMAALAALAALQRALRSKGAGGAPPPGIAAG